jgi:3-oxoacyl-[acyl-carrier protein] reductase
VISVRRAIVTGGSGGIGSAICRRLAADGHHVLVHSNTNRESALRVVGEIAAAGGSAQAVCFDIADCAQTRDALEAVLLNGAIHIVVNNAGVHDDAVFAGMRLEQWRRVIDVSVHGFFHVTQPLTLPMVRERWGRIINISSISALVGHRGQVNYAAAKGALNAATRSLAAELASRGVTVNAVAPGIIDTPMTRGVFDRAAIESLVPMKRAGTAQEVADLVGFLASDQASYITGQVIAIHGGMF